MSTDIDKSTIDLLNKKVGKLENDMAENTKSDSLKIALLEQQVLKRISVNGCRLLCSTVSSFTLNYRMMDLVF